MEDKIWERIQLLDSSDLNFVHFYKLDVDICYSDIEKLYENYISKYYLEDCNKSQDSIFSDKNNADPIPIGAPINNAPPAIKAVPDNKGNIPKFGLVPLGTHLVPNKNSKVIRLINEIILDEETDLNNRNIPKSHFEIYLDAMKEANADVTKINQLLILIEEGIEIKKALNKHKNEKIWQDNWSEFVDAMVFKRFTILEIIINI